MGRQPSESTACQHAATPGAALCYKLGVDTRIEGMWMKDAAASDTMEDACSVMKLNGLMRNAVKLIRGLRLGGLNEGRVDIAACSIVAWFKIRESYPLDGSVGFAGRRDLRRGKQAATVAVDPDGSLRLTTSWDEPVKGGGTDHCTLFPAPDGGPDRLLIKSTISVGEQTVAYNTWYRRRR